MANRIRLAVLLLACATVSNAQNYPNQPIRLVVPDADIVKASGARVV